MIINKAQVLDKVVTPKKATMAAVLILLLMFVDINLETASACTGDIVIRYTIFGSN